MHTVMTLLALLPQAPEGDRVTLTFELNYRHAKTVAATAQKPLAVFVGAGADGWSKVVRDGGFDLAALKLLAERYVLVYADRDTEAGRKLAGALEINSDCGLVISDRGGGFQVFRHDG